MAVLSRVLSIFLRAGETIFAIVVTGLVAWFIDISNGRPPWRFIYTIVISVISILLGLLWLLPFSGGFISWPADVIISALWFAAFGLMVAYNNGSACDVGTFNWSGITAGGACNRFRAMQAFTFLSAIFWIVSALVGLWFTYRRTDRKRVSRARV